MAKSRSHEETDLGTQKDISTLLHAVEILKRKLSEGAGAPFLAILNDGRASVEGGIGCEIVP